MTISVSRILCLLSVAFITAEAVALDDLPAAIPFASKWLTSAHNTLPVKNLTPTASGAVSVDLEFPGNAQLWQEIDRNTLRPDREKFRRRYLKMEIMAEGIGAEKIRGVFFVKDKDGLWFQNPEPFTLVPGQPLEVGADLTSGSGDLIPIGHTTAWNSHFAVGLHAAGISLFGNANAKIRITSRPICFTGLVPRPPLQLKRWSLPPRGTQYKMIESRFNLSREYFNPFDPDEVKIDFEVISPEGKTETWPAFYSQEYTRRIFCNREQSIPRGQPFWAFRFTPRLSGEYRFRLRIEDRSAVEPENILSQWQTLTVAPSAANPGFIRVSQLDPKYFEFENGSLFYPIGMNIHTNIDVRSEKAFGYGHIPDNGTFDYDTYFAAMKQNRMNLAEIWMASWTFAIEWSSSCQNYYGLGRYSLANASRLDYILNAAANHGIYVNLVLDNHGKMSSHSDQEWDESPFNVAHDFAAANGAFLKAPVDFFSSAEAMRYNQVRNRYIAARWGAFTSILGIELWSEGNLVTAFEQIYANDVAVDWVAKTADALAADDSGRHLITTHFCGDYANNLLFRKIEDLPQMKYVVGDAYRDVKIPFFDQMHMQFNALKEFPKPVWITEFGGTAGGGNDPVLEADIKTALWSSLPKYQAGAPLTWWHDFVHRRNLYYLYQAFAGFMDGVDPRGKNFVYLNLPVMPAAMIPPQLKAPANGLPGERARAWSQAAATGERVLDFKQSFYYESTHNPANPESRNYPWDCFAVGGGNEAYGWIFYRPAMRHTSPSDSTMAPFTKMLLPLDLPVNSGRYSLTFFNTNTGKPVHRDIVDIKQPTMPILQLPPFTTDIAFKLLRLDAPGPSRLNSTGKQP